ncbi:hypothetical protein D3C80_930120 [compost metagenome]
MSIEAFVFAPGVVGIVVQPAVIGDIDRRAIDKGSAAIVRNIVLILTVGYVEGRFITIPAE